MNTIVGFIGFGLIGGSIAKGLKKIHPEYTIMAYARTTSVLEQAKADGTIDIVLTAVDEHFSQCDYIFLCTPVTYNAQYLSAIKPYLKDGCILTDVGSTKANIHHEVIAQGLETYFIGGHPMAGSERTGYANATDHLLENAFYVITPSAKCHPDDVRKLTALVKELGAIPIQLDYNRHDYVVAAISHLPHIIAASLVNLVRDSDSPEQTMKQVAAGGFKDITRIASSSPVMWEQIIMNNQTNLSLLMRDYIASLERILTDIENGHSEAICRLFEESGAYRNSFQDMPAGPMNKEYSLYCDIVDQAGAISTISTILAAGQISIKNIGIIHNRSFEQGALKIEFYKEDACTNAVELLTRFGYTIYARK